MGNFHKHLLAGTGGYFKLDRTFNNQVGMVGCLPRAIKHFILAVSPQTKAVRTHHWPPTKNSSIKNNLTDNKQARKNRAIQGICLLNKQNAIVFTIKKVISIILTIDTNRQ
jgi:hypothetical protein